jgi:ATP-dependent Clp protease, protease subunit
MTRRINRDDVDKLHEFGLHVPTRTVYLESTADDEGNEHGVGFSMAQRVVKNLRLLDHASADPITLIINTNGGDIFFGMGIYDAIRACRSPIRGIVVGNACSMGCVLLQACDARLSTPNSTIMYHAGTMDGAPDYPFREGKRATDYEYAMGERIDRLVFARVEAKKSLSWEKFKTETDRGLYFFPEQALEWGLIDAVSEEAL